MSAARLDLARARELARDLDRDLDRDSTLMSAAP